MNILFENPDKVNGLMTVTVEEADFKDDVEKTLKDYRKKANFPGFRPGMVPMGLIKKQFGASVKMDTLNKFVGEKIYTYIKDNKIQMLGEPLPSEKQEPVDIEKDGPYTFMFDIAVAPEFKIELNGDTKLAYYNIKADDKLIDQQVDMFASQLGSYEKADSYDGEQRDMLKGDLRELDADAAKTARQLLLLESARNRLGKEDIMQYNVTIKTIPERYAACVHTIIPRYSEEGSVWQTPCEETGGMRLVPDEPCYCAVTFLDGEYKERDVEIEAWKTVKGSYPDTAHVKFRTLPAVTVASCTFRGPYERIGEVYAAIAAWIADNGYECDGPMFNIYHVSPYETQNPEEFVTEACYPVRKQ